MHQKNNVLILSTVTLVVFFICVPDVSWAQIIGGVKDPFGESPDKGSNLGWILFGILFLVAVFGFVHMYYINFSVKLLVIYGGTFLVVLILGGLLNSCNRKSSGLIRIKMRNQPLKKPLLC